MLPIEFIGPCYPPNRIRMARRAPAAIDHPVAAYAPSSRFDDGIPERSCPPEHLGKAKLPDTRWRRRGF